MPYSVLIWLNTAQQPPVPGAAAVESTGGILEDQVRHAPGLAAGALSDPPHDRLVYGFYEDRKEADAALERIAAALRDQAPLRISRRQDRQFIIPAGSIRYIACEQVERPRDEKAG